MIGLKNCEYITEAIVLRRLWSVEDIKEKSFEFKQQIFNKNVF